MAIEIKIGATFDGKDIARAQRELDKLGRVARKQSETTVQSMERMGKSFENVGKNMSMKVTAPLVALGAVAVKFASDLEESQSKVQVVFGASADAVRDFAKQSATSMGMSEASALEAAGTYGNLFRAMGIGQKESQNMSTTLVQLAGDLASFNNTSVDDAILALRSGLSGETEPLKRFGVNLTVARIKTEALSMGLMEQGGELTAAAKAQATYSLVMKDTTLAQGDFARTSDGAANSMKIAKAQLENAAASIGTILLPVVTKLAGAIGGFAGFVSGLPGPIKTLVVVFGGLAAAIGPIIYVTGTLMTNLAAIAKTRMGSALIEGFGALRSAVAGARAESGGLAGALRSRVTPAMVAGGIAVAAFALALQQINSKWAKEARDSLSGLVGDVDGLRVAALELAQSGQVIGPLNKMTDAFIHLKSEMDMSQIGGDKGAFNWQYKIVSAFSDVNENADAAREAIANMDSVLTDMFKADPAGAERLFGAVAKMAEEAGIEIEDLAGMLPGYGALVEAAGESTGGTAGALESLASGFGGVAEETGNASQALDDWASKVKAQFDPLWGVQDAVWAVQEANMNLFAAQVKVNETVAKFGPDSVEARAAYRDLDLAQRGTIMSAGELNAKYLDLVAGVQAGDIPLSDAIATIDGLAASHQISAETANEQRQKFDDLARLVLGTEFPNVEIPINTNAAEVLERLQTIRDVVTALGGRITAQLPEFMRVGGSAAGGPVSAGRPGWVGERGPELFIPSTDGVIVPHYESRRMMSDAGTAGPAGGGDTFNITINGMVGKDKRDILDFLARELPKAAATHSRSFG